MLKPFPHHFDAWFVIVCAALEPVWYHSGLPVVPLRWVLIRDGEGKLAPQALLSTDVTLSAQQIVEWFVLRWQLEVTFEEARAHLGVLLHLP